MKLHDNIVYLPDGVIYIVLVLQDDLTGEETIEKIFNKKELAEKYIEKCNNLCEAEKYRFRIIKEEIITNLSTVL